MHESVGKTERTGKLKASIGICAYNEENNIGNLLRSIRTQELGRIEIAQVVVVSSACRDSTNTIVRAMRLQDPRIALIEQPQRNGKASAVNLFLRTASEGICILISADTVLASELSLIHI